MVEVEAIHLAVEAHDGGCRLIRVWGALTRDGADRLLRLVDSQLDLTVDADRTGCLVVDLEAVSHYEPGAPECLRHARDSADRRGTPLYLTGWADRPLPPRIRAVLREFPGYGTAEQALTDLAVETAMSTV